jgi:hypothetical protein
LTQELRVVDNRRAAGEERTSLVWGPRALNVGESPPIPEQGGL